MDRQASAPWGKIAFGAALLLAACSEKPGDQAALAGSNAAQVAGNAAAPATGAAKGAAAADNVDTLSGAKLASFTGDAKKGELVFVACKICHTPDKNMIGPMIRGIVGRRAGTVAGFAYSEANKHSGLVWSPEKLFQYLEKPQRVVPGTKMVYPGLRDPQQRADLIAYLETLK